MGWLWDGQTAGGGTADFGATYQISSYPFTIGLHFREDNWISGYTVRLTLGSYAASNTGSYGFRMSDQADRFEPWHRSDAPATSGYPPNTDADGTFDNLWTPVMCRFISQTNTTIHVGSRANVYASNNDWAFVANPLRYFVLNGNLESAPSSDQMDFAEIAIWASNLSDANIDAYMDRTAKASAIDASNLRAYWPLDANDTSPADEINSIELTLTNGAYGDPASGDHPSYSLNTTIPVPTGPWR